MAFFDNVKEAPPDAILGLSVAFKDDKRPDKVNLGVGAYKTEALEPYVLTVVRKAEERIVARRIDKEYLGIDGLPEFLARSAELVFGDSVDPRTLASAQAPGGTGALRIAGEFLRQEVGERIAIPDPSWANHKTVFQRAGLAVDTYPYYDADRKVVRVSDMLNALGRMNPGSLVLFHASSHNPTGLDPTDEEWMRIEEAVRARGLLPLFDFAYQGFGRGLDEDAFAVRHFARQGHAMLVAASYSKNFGLYGERVGALFVLAGSERAAKASLSQIKVLIRGNYSNPPSAGCRIVAEVLGSADLRKEWEVELTTMRGRIDRMRRSLAEGLRKAGSRVDFSFMLRQRGIFSFSGLDKSKVDRLRSEFGIYMPSDGRINVAGLTHSNLDYVVRAILAVL